MIRQAAVPPLERSRQLIQGLYPKAQYQKIAHLFKDNPPPFEDRAYDMPPWENGKPPCLVILIGLTNIEFMKKFMFDKSVQENVKGLILIENNETKITQFLNDPFFNQLLTSPQVRIMFNADDSSFRPMLFNILKEPVFSSIMEDCVIFVNDEEKDEERLNFYVKIKRWYEEAVFHVYHNYGRIDDSLEGVRASFQNKEFVQKAPGLTECKDLYKGKTAAIVAAGPSLDDNIDTLAANKDKFVIFAADAAVKPLLKAGIEPDFTTSIERGNEYQIPFWTDLPSIKTQLFFYPVVHPECLHIYPGPKRAVYRNYSYYAYFERSWPKGLMSSGGSTTHLSFNIARYMGCEEFVFIGVDNAYGGPREDGKYRTHCNNLGYREWADYLSVDEIKAKKGAHLALFKAPAVDGTEILTSLTYSQWAQEFGELILSGGLDGKIHITNKKAHAIAGARYNPLESICNSLTPIENKPTPPMEPHHGYRKWDNQYLKKCVRGWLRQARDVVGLASDAQKLDKDEDKKIIVQQLFQYIHFKMRIDTLFVGFIIQNCAKEFYILENKWNRADRDNPSQRLEIISEYGKLFEEVLLKLVKLLEDTEEK